MKYYTILLLLFKQWCILFNIYRKWLVIAQQCLFLLPTKTIFWNMNRATTTLAWSTSLLLGWSIADTITQPLLLGWSIADTITQPSYCLALSIHITNNNSMRMRAQHSCMLIGVILLLNISVLRTINLTHRINDFIYKSVLTLTIRSSIDIFNLNMISILGSRGFDVLC